MNALLYSKGGKWMSLVVGVLVLAALACGPFGAASTPTPLPPTPIPPTVPPAASVTVINQTGSTICYLYVSPSTSDEWGADQLGTNNVIGAGQSFTLTVQPGTYDLRAEDCEGNALAEQYNVALGQFTWTVVAAPVTTTGTLTIVNNTASTVCYVYISPSDSEEWGQDQLGANNTVPSGGMFDITNIPAGIYDLKATDCDNVTLAQQYGVTLGDQDYTWTLSRNTAQLVIVNDSSLDICYLYVSPSDAGDWGPDQLGEQIIAAGSQFTLRGITPGTYDLRFEACSGEELEEYGVNISDVFTYTITD